MSIGYIKQMNKEAEDRAKANGLRPIIIKRSKAIDYTKDIIINRLRSIPNLGDYRPKGWKLVKDYLVDSSGFGSPSEPAYTIDQFADEIEVGFGYGIIECGQFQVVIGKFKRVD